MYLHNNLGAFIRLEMYERKKSVYDVAKFLNVDISYLYDSLSRHVKLNEKLACIISYLNLEKKEVFKRNLSFEKIRNRFFYSVFYCLDERDYLYKEILSISQKLNSSPYKIDILIIKYIYTVSVLEDYSCMNDYINCFEEILPFLSTYYQKVYLVFLLYYLNNTSQLKNVTELFEYIEKLPCNDVHLEGRVNYLGLSVFRRIGQIARAEKCYFRAKDYLNKVQNVTMLENLNLKYSGMLRMTGKIRKALNNDLALLESYIIKQYRLRNIEILYNNIAWTYSLLHDYKKAVFYYQKALETLNDNDVYFNIAFCCYRIGEEPMASNYVQLGKKAPSCGDYIYLLLDWLELMIQDRYSHKTMQALQNILRNYESDLEEIDKDTIKIEIVNYYYYNHMYEEAIHALQPLMGKQLISPSELIFTKKDENRNDLLFSEDELTLRSQMMESDDLFFEDDELGEDEWEELDDSFSRFTHN